MWKVAPSYATWTLKKVDEENHKAYVEERCWKCGGSGEYAWFGTCYACMGAGRIGKWVKAYTEDEYNRYIKSQEKAKERKAAAAAELDAKLQAESDANLAAALKEKGYDTSNPFVYVVGGKSTYEIKDWLKEHGFKFNPALLWYTSHKVEVPEGYALAAIPFFDVFTWNYKLKDFLMKDEAKERAEAALATLAIPSKSEWIGEEKERLRDLEVVLTGCHSFDGYYGTTFIYTFHQDDNVLVWMTSSCKDIEVGDHLFLTGTVKSHDEYKGEKQTKLSRCIIKRER